MAPFLSEYPGMVPGHDAHVLMPIRGITCTWVNYVIDNMGYRDETCRYDIETTVGKTSRRWLPGRDQSRLYGDRCAVLLLR